VKAEHGIEDNVLLCACANRQKFVSPDKLDESDVGNTFSWKLNTQRNKEIYVQNL